MRIAQVAPPWEPVPPAGYGGTERVVHHLTEQLVALGHQVTLFASGDSQTSAELVAVTPKALRAAGVRDASPFILEELDRVRGRGGDFDVVHCHVDYYAFPFARDLTAPVMHTMHGRLDLPEIAPIFHRFRDQPLVSISDSQRIPLPDQHWLRTIYHGLPADLYRFRERPSDYALFLGRISPEKRPDWAIEIAERAGIRLVIAAKADPADQAYFDEVFRPALERAKRAEFIGEIGDDGKNELIGNAIALIMPIDWPEPFGLTAIEALACGTPVLARPCGALPELVTDGVDGFLRHDIVELAQLLGRISDISRADCRRTFERRFTDVVMARQYVEAYEELAASGTPGGANPVVSPVAKPAPRPEPPAEDPWSTVDSALSASVPKLVLKGDHAYAVVDSFGDVPEWLRGEFGFYNRGTRLLSNLRLRISDKRPVLLGSAYHPDTDSIVADLGNELITLAGGATIQQNALHLRRELRIEHDVLRQRLTVTSFADVPVEVVVSLDVAGDFADLFEVRGTRRAKRGQLAALRRTANGEGAVIEYAGLDGVERSLQITFSEGAEGEGARFRWPVALAPGAVWQLDTAFDGRTNDPHSTFRILGKSRKVDNWLAGMPHVETSDEVLTGAIRQAFRDLNALMSSGVDGVFPTAGIPWYATLFGRDSLVTALQLLPWSVETAVSTFFTLAHFQAEADDAFTDAEPGKILHEWREGEMANLREIPFIPYYGTVDATLLFIHLAHEIHALTGDRKLLARMWPHLVRAWEWIDRHGSASGDELIDYRCRSPIGLRNQGWKDSWDAISHADGTLAEGAIALVEVQAYAVAALRELASLADDIDAELATRARRRADAIHARVERDYWMEEEGCYGLALDGERRLCRVVTSNAGQTLFAGLPDPVRAKQIAQRLMAPDLSSGFGIRTLSQGAKRYNPMSYHNGSVWPHDNALIAEGLRRYGLHEEMSQLHRTLLDAICTFPLRRVPELFCGFGSDQVQQPVPYPTACAPQAWSSGAVLMLLRQMLNLRIDRSTRRLAWGPVALPKGVAWVRIRGLRVGGVEEDIVEGRASGENKTPPERGE